MSNASALAWSMPAARCPFHVSFHCLSSFDSARIRTEAQNEGSRWLTCSPDFALPKISWTLPACMTTRRSRILRRPPLLSHWMIEKLHEERTTRYCTDQSLLASLRVPHACLSHGCKENDTDVGSFCCSLRPDLPMTFLRNRAPF